ncbi:DUF4112 domain-containing protein [Tateyamaria omphalii]|uniref:DUF4112 domain-containing protein n=1 Tax=Tateyamaria omphalii TaxID=299262 RepID=A0A1P8MTI0_9RHOB|nr:DUF4112 domain-containing protein [Tateyamaria omphalii]APX11348.1 hypothetical protein BWR18_06390 [Tateyamaria omphalii]
MPDCTDQIEHLDRIARTMDRAVRLPIVGVHVGWDSILGLIPGIGDALTLGPAGYIVVQAHRMGTPGALKARMLGNIGIDALIGSIPLVGDLFDIGWKANTRNVALLRKHFESEQDDAPNGAVTSS